MKPTPKYVNKPVSDDPRDVEAWALSEAARRLIDASRTPDDWETFQNALLLNQRLWTIFQAAISEPDCPMPQDMRTNIAALSLMVDRETMARLADQDVTKLDMLITINRNVASGLSQKIGAAASAAAPQPGIAPAAPAAAAPVPPPMRPAGYPPAAGGYGQPAPRPAAAPGSAEPAPAPREGLRISI